MPGALSFVNQNRGSSNKTIKQSSATKIASTAKIQSTVLPSSKAGKKA
jgi:hypothetical protein